ncbi:hypothetical protein FACS189429_3560 [Bacteroidia bacterium]|nr:hypothetical protein FACS189429_3560 [Bacteroidia bacterium]
MLSIITFSLVACEKIIEFKGKETQPLLVVNSIIQPDSTLLVSVTNSVFFLSNNLIEPIENADVLLFVNNNFVEKMEYVPVDHDGYSYFTYNSHYKLKAGDKVRYEVSAPNFDKVWAEVTIPVPVTIIALDTLVEQNIYETDTYNYTPEKWHCKMKFADNANEKNYYRLSVVKKIAGYNSYTGEYEVRQMEFGFNSNDMLFNNDPANSGIIYEYSNEYNIFSDDMINGKEYTLAFDIEPENGGLGQISENDSTFFYFRLENLSYEYYMYLRTLSSQNDDMGFLAEPTQIFTNINGGIGILGAFSVSDKKVEWKAPKSQYGI